jgi:hypothetical protein
MTVGHVASQETWHAGASADAAKWLEPHVRPKDVKGTLNLTRFVEPVYVLTKPISWKAGASVKAKLAPVEVPAGFVTDFASVPRLFWSVLRPDGEYAYAAVLHDYLYWMQTGKREEADLVLKYAMEEFKVGAATIDAIYTAVDKAGQIAWAGNARLKASGERRILKSLPDDPKVRWADWKRRPGVFAGSD